MRKLLSAVGVLAAILVIAVLSGCGYQGNFRYPCQDPKNWKLEECQPPICEASDTCTKDLLPEEMSDETVNTTAP